MKSALYKLLLLGCLSGTPGQILAQDTAYARLHLDTLSSAAFYGRGYVNRGQQLAAEYLLREFARLGLEDLSGNYLQPFPVEVNRIDSVLLQVNGKKLVPGTDYLVHPNTGSGQGQKLKPGKEVALFAKNSKPKVSPQTRLLLETDYERLMWSVGRDAWPLPYFQLRAGSLPQKIKQVDFVVQSSFEEMMVANVAGLIRGQRQPDSVIILCAHYDHLGMMGAQTLFAGANDNASGTALLLDLARHYSQPENRPDYSLLFIAFGAEEAGLVGSQHYVKKPLLPLSQTHFVINLDLMAGGSEGMMVVNGEKQQTAWQLLDSLNRSRPWLTEIKVRGNAANSDHYPFTQAGVPAVFLYTLGDVTAYHDPNDLPQALTWQHYASIFNIIRQFTDACMQIKPDDER